LLDRVGDKSPSRGRSQIALATFRVSPLAREAGRIIAISVEQLSRDPLYHSVSFMGPAGALDSHIC
jgi:hypothetical protein